MLNKLVKIVAKKKKRIGRGIGSGKGGHTVGRGHEGQKARAGFKRRMWFEGGQNPLIKSLPVRKGFKRPGKRETVPINLSKLSTLLDVSPSGAGKSTNQITENVIRSCFKIDSSKDIKILAKGGVKKAIVVKGVKVSRQAKAKIEKAGGKVIP